MWCSSCNVPVNFNEKCTAVNHLKTAKHIENVYKYASVVQKPGASAFRLFLAQCTLGTTSPGLNCNESLKDATKKATLITQFKAAKKEMVSKFIDLPGTGRN